VSNAIRQPQCQGVLAWLAAITAAEQLLSPAALLQLFPGSDLAVCTNSSLIVSCSLNSSRPSVFDSQQQGRHWAYAGENHYSWQRCSRRAFSSSSSSSCQASTEQAWQSSSSSSQQHITEVEDTLKLAAYIRRCGPWQAMLCWSMASMDWPGQGSHSRGGLQQQLPLSLRWRMV
jgi:hypothetical protein